MNGQPASHDSFLVRELPRKTTPTYYHNFNADLPFFLDYAYTDIPVKFFRLLPWDKDMSDHIGMEVEI